MCTYEVRFQDQAEKAEKLNLIIGRADKWEKLDNLIFNFEVYDDEADDFDDYMETLDVEYKFV